MSIYDDIKDIKKKAALEVFNRILKEPDSSKHLDYAADGISLHRIVRTDNPEFILLILNKLSLEDNLKLELEKDFWESFGKYHVVVSLPNGNSSRDIFKYLSVEDSKQGAWHAYLLFSLWHTLPLNDHSNYSRREYIFSKDALLSIDIKNEPNLSKELYNFDPKLTILGKGEFYYVSCYYWNRYSGLNKSINEIQIRNNRVIDINEIHNQNIIEYGRDIRI